MNQTTDTKQKNITARVSDGFVVMSDSQIVPDDLQSELIAIAEDMTSSAFRIGDIALQICVDNAKNGSPVTVDRVYSAVGRYCGRSGRTVRYYAETCAFYEKEVREEFSIAPFSHFVFARKMGLMWRDIMEHSVSQPGMTLAELTRRFDVREIGEVSHNSYVDNTQVVKISGDIKWVVRDTETGEVELDNYCEVSQNSGTGGSDVLLVLAAEASRAAESAVRLTNALESCCGVVGIDTIEQVKLVAESLREFSTSISSLVASISV